MKSQQGGGNRKVEPSVTGPQPRTFRSEDKCGTCGGYDFELLATMSYPSVRAECIACHTENYVTKRK